MRILRPTLILGLILSIAIPAFGVEAPRNVHRASQEGGTGLTLMRTGDQLDPKEMNASIFLTYMAFDKLPLYPARRADNPYIDDPRGNELWMTLAYNYGINNLFEVGAQIPLEFLSDMRDPGVGRIAVDGRLRILNVNRFGLGISSTLWLSAPSFQSNNSSNTINGAFELGFMLQGAAGTNYLGSEGFDRFVLEPLRLYANAGWGYEDYIEFEKFDPALLPDPWNPRNPDLPRFVGTEVLYGSLGFDYEVYDKLYVGGELLARQHPLYRNDNNFIWVFPDVSYTYKDMFSLGFALGLTDLGAAIHDSSPDWQVTSNFTYHFPSLYHVAEAQPTPPPPQDLIEIFVPSRKPIPTEMQEQEVPIAPSPNGGATPPPPPPPPPPQ